MITAGWVKKGSYFDSVTLMKVAREMTSIAGVVDAAAVMGTEENRGILASSGLALPEFGEATGTDVLVAVRGEDEAAVERALAGAIELLDAVRRRARSGGEYLPKSIDGALEEIPDANLALISVAGRYAGDLALQALSRGLHVMIFSDHVPLETEVALKRFAAERGLLVMGPDCGTAILNGAPLGFANVVNRGPIGIVAAAGTGLQEVTSIISNVGSGISQAIGTGGRDVGREVGGIMFLEGLNALADDPKTRVILLVSKPPDGAVRERIAEAALGTRKPVVTVFLGDEPRGPRDVRTLEEGAVAAVVAAAGEIAAAVRGTLESREPELERIARGLADKTPGRRRHIRALMSGGTFAAEAQVVFRMCGVRDVSSNVPTAGAASLADARRSVGNTVVDLGADEFTVGRPHPMIDYTIRKKRIAEEADDPDTAVILLDVVLGYGSNPDPLSDLAETVGAATRHVAVVASVTGTAGDPQDRGAVVGGLMAAGAVVAPSNASASRIGALVARRLEEH